MRAKFINEFERGLDPRETLNIGYALHKKNLALLIEAIDFIVNSHYVNKSKIEPYENITKEFVEAGFIEKVYNNAGEYHYSHYIGWEANKNNPYYIGSKVVRLDPYLLIHDFKDQNMYKTISEAMYNLNHLISEDI